MTNLNGNVVTVLVIIMAILGGAIVLLSALVSGMDPALRLSFRDYIEAMGVAIGLLAVGRGLTARTQT